MKERMKRLRIFAGPNGSGKSTLYNYLAQVKAFNTYYHINPDLIAKDISVSLNLDNWPIEFNFKELDEFLKYSPFQTMVNFNISGLLLLEGQRISLKETTFKDSYMAAAIADFIRYKMIQSNSSFSYETVFSHSSKLKELKIAKKAGYKIYLYFITLSDPLINLQRIKNRVETGGYDVPEEKVFNRYNRTLNNLYPAFKLADKAYFFDNSSKRIDSSFDFFAEKKDDNIYLPELKNIPQWFDEYILKNI